MPHSLTYRTEIDGLRAIAVLAVLFYHAGLPIAQAGFLGVDIFFVISGYLITSILMQSNLALKPFLLNFYERRVRRIVPLLYTTIALSFLVSFILHLPSDFKSTSLSLLSAMAFVSNFYFLETSNYFSQASEFEPFLHTWSLAIEEQFYLIIPFLIFFFRNSKLLIFILTALVLGSLAATPLVCSEKPNDCFYLPHVRFWELGIGALIALPTFQVAKLWCIRKVAYAQDFLTLACLGAVIGLLVLSDPAQIYPNITSLGVVLCTAGILVLAPQSGWSQTLLANPIMRVIGLGSFSLYLWHQPVFAFTRYGLDRVDLQWPWILLAFAVTLGLSVLSYHWIEKPFRDRTKFSGARIWQAFLFSSLSLCVLIAAITYSPLANWKFLFYEDDVLITHEERGLYVRQYFLKFRHKMKFRSSTKPNIFVAGDSYAQDFANVLKEAGLIRKSDFATHYIPARCQISVRPHGFREYYQKNLGYHGICMNAKRIEEYSLKARQALIEDADLLVLAAQWQPWSAEHLSESLDYIQATKKPDARVLIVSSKVLEYPKHWRTMSEAEKQSYRFSKDEKTQQITASLKRVIEASELWKNNQISLFDPMEILCSQGRDSCLTFDQNGNLLTYDGGHLTQNGAKFLGRSLPQLF